MILTPTEPAHFSYLDQEVASHTMEELQIGDRLQGAAASYAQMSMLAYTAWDGGIVIGMGGVIPLWEGVGEAWLFTSKNFTDYGLAAARVTKNIIRFCSDSGMHRVQCAVKADFVRGRKFVEWLGFQDEGIMRRYGTDGSDFVRYARVEK